MKKGVDRRSFLKGSCVAGLAVGLMPEEHILMSHLAQAPAKPAESTDAEPMPTGKIGNLTVSRLISGGNLIGGWAHARDLLYASKLFKSYNTDEKILETLQILEEHGVNTIVTNPVSGDIINRYWKERGGKIQWICEGHPRKRDLTTDVKRSIDKGAAAVYIQGAIGDAWLKKGTFDLVPKVVEYVKECGVPSGVGAHKLEVIKESEKQGVNPDFYVKTLHKNTYWSRQRPEQTTDVIGNRADNYWSITPEDTIDFMRKVDKPWIAFKTLAAGAIHPKVGLKYAFDGGADFVCLGMFDFQVAEDVGHTKRVLASVKRQRPWRA